MINFQTLPKWVEHVDLSQCSVEKLKDGDHCIISHELQTMIATGTKQECEQHLGVNQERFRLN